MCVCSYNQLYRDPDCSIIAPEEQLSDRERMQAYIDMLLPNGQPINRFQLQVSSECMVDCFRVPRILPGRGLVCLPGFWAG